jgi:hypothetical protein
MSAADLSLFFIWVGAIPQTVFVLLYGFASPWYRYTTGRAIFTKALGLALILDLSIAVHHFGQLPTWVGPVVLGFVAVGCWLQLGALVHERRSGGRLDHR